MVNRPPMVTRDMLQRRVDELDALLPGLVRKHPDREALMTELAGHADRITEAARAEDDQWIVESIDKLLNRYGLTSAQVDPPAAD